VPPGGDGVFAFNAVGPLTIGTYHFQWQMLQEGVGYFGDATPDVLVYVADGFNNAAAGPAGTPGVPVPTTMVAGQSYPVSVTMTNSGTTIWTSGGAYVLASQNPAENLIWGIKRVTPLAPVAPGGVVSFSFNVTAPVTPGNYNFQWGMLQDGVGPFGNPTTNLVITVVASGLDAAFVTQSVPQSAFVGQSVPVSITMSNRGGVSWDPAVVSIHSQSPADNLVWGTNSIRLPALVPPGGDRRLHCRRVSTLECGQLQFPLADVWHWIGILRGCDVQRTSQCDCPF
jgi:hypothetical protein